MLYFGVLLSVICVATAAPFFDSSSSEENDHHGHLWAPDFYHDGIFDTSRFWKNLEDELHQIDRHLSEFHRRFPSQIPSDRYENEKYIITVDLQGFDENEIKVSAKKQLLIIQAVHKATDSELVSNSYTSLRNLPNDVSPEGTWIYGNGKLEITFPLVQSIATTVPVEEVSSTAAPVDREVMENTNHSEDVGNADVGLLHNEISNEIEATTYPVDLSNDVEFVPIKY